jgi:hypothetical protein
MASVGKVRSSAGGGGAGGNWKLDAGTPPPYSAMILKTNDLNVKILKTKELRVKYSNQAT